MRRLLPLLAAALALTVSAPAAARSVKTPVCGAAVNVPEPLRQHLTRFAERMGFRHTGAAAGVIFHVHRTGRLPDCYVTKRAARARGWRPGRSLWPRLLGTAIGGDRFYNREGRLPGGAFYIEADLDYAGGRRNARRLVFDRRTRGAWAIWVTLDHYRSFRRVPRPAPARRD